MYKQEKTEQEARIQKLKDDGKDEYDVRKQVRCQGLRARRLFLS